MLDLMRRNARSWVIKAALAGVAITFIFMYGAPNRTPDSERSVAEVNGSPITRNEFDDMYNRQLDNLKRRFQGSLPDAIDTRNLKKMVLGGMIHQQLVIQEAARLGFFITEDDLAKDIMANPRFQRDGKFSEEDYRAFLRAIKLSTTEYEAHRKEEMLYDQVARVLTDGIKTDPKETKEFWHFQNDKIRLSYLVINPEPADKNQKVDHKDLGEFFGKNQEKYRVPESVDLECVIFSWKDVAKKITIPEEEVLSFYKNNPKDFVIPEKIKLRHILISVPPQASEGVDKAARQTIEGIRERIQKGESFESLAQAESQDKDSAPKGGELGLFAVGSMSKEFESAVKDLKAGEVSMPVRTAMGYHLLKVDEIKPEGTVTFDEAKEKLKDSLLEKKAREQLDHDADQLYENAYRTEELEGPAQRFGLSVKKVIGVTKAMGIPDLGRAPDLMEEVFQLKVGEISKLMKSGDVYAVIKVEKQAPARIPELQEGKETVEKDFLADQALGRARKRAEEIIAELKKNPKEYEEVAKKFGLTWKDLEPVPRGSGLVPQLGSAPEIREMLVTVSSSAPLFPSPIPIPDGMGIVRLAGLEPADDATYEKEAPEFKQRVDHVLRTEFEQGWLKVLEEQAKIVRHD